MKTFNVPVNVLGKDFVVPVIAPVAELAKKMVTRQVTISVKVTGEPQEVEGSADPKPEKKKGKKKD